MKAKQKSKNKKAFVKKEKKSKKGIYLMVVLVLIVAIMVLSLIVPGANNDSDGSYEYNGFQVIPQNSYWAVGLGGNYLPFEYDPRTIENFTAVDFELIDKEVYLSYDPAEGMVGAYSRVEDFLRSFGYNVIPSCLVEEDCPDIPVIDCSQDKQIIFFNEGDEVSISLKENCVSLNSAKTDSYVVANLFMYKTIGVI
jgi:hypothetical protein